MSEGKFPKNIHLGPKISVWIEREIHEWINSQILLNRHQLVFKVSYRPLFPVDAINGNGVLRGALIVYIGEYWMGKVCSVGCLKIHG